MLAEFTINNKIYLTTKVSPFIANYSRELRMGIDLGRKEKVKKIMEFAKRMRKVQEEAGVVLKKVQKKIKRQADREEISRLICRPICYQQDSIYQCS